MKLSSSPHHPSEATENPFIQDLTRYMETLKLEAKNPLKTGDNFQIARKLTRMIESAPFPPLVRNKMKLSSSPHHPSEATENPFIQDLTRYMETLKLEAKNPLKTGDNFQIARKLTRMIESAPFPPLVRNKMKLFLLKAERDPNFKPEDLLFDDKTIQELSALCHKLDENNEGYDERLGNLIRYMRSLIEQQDVTAQMKGDLFDRAMAAKEEGKMDEAKKLYEKLAELGDPGACNNLGVIAYEEGKIEEAKELYGKAAEMGNQTARNNLAGYVKNGLLNLAKIAENQGGVDDAKEWYKNAENAGGMEVGNLYFYLGYIANRKGELEEAKKWYQKSVERTEWHGAYNNLGLIAEEEGRIEEAKALFKKAAEMGNPNAQDSLDSFDKRKWRKRMDLMANRIALVAIIGTMGTLGVSVIGRNCFGSEEQVVEKTEEAPKQKTNSPDPKKATEMEDSKHYFDLACNARNEGKIDEAKKWYQKAAEMGNSFAYNELGVIAYREGKIEEAKALFKKAAEMGNRFAYYNLGVSTEREGKMDEAKRLYKKAAEMALWPTGIPR